MLFAALNCFESFALFFVIGGACLVHQLTKAVNSSPAAKGAAKQGLGWAIGKFFGK